MSVVAMETLTLPAGESQFEAFCGHYFLCAITSRGVGGVGGGGDDVTTPRYLEHKILTV